MIWQAKGTQFVFCRVLYAATIFFYKDVWTPSVGKVLTVSREPGNGHNRYAVCVKRGGEIVGHVPRQFSHIVWYFLCRVFSCLA